MSKLEAFKFADVRVFQTFYFIDFFSLDWMEEELGICSSLLFIVVDVEETLIVLSM